VSIFQGSRTCSGRKVPAEAGRRCRRFCYRLLNRDDTLGGLASFRIAADAAICAPREAALAGKPSHARVTRAPPTFPGKRRAGLTAPL
jgi:hypothetical protein